ncbi:MAG: hypothetical protein ABFS19_11370 [Thermodesulfobacteriota bacterium]
MKLRTCVRPDGRFRYGIHKPAYDVANLRHDTNIQPLGKTGEDHTVDNRCNYPEGDIHVKDADWIFEIPNPLPFRGSTFLDKEWADNSRITPEKMTLGGRKPLSLSSTLRAEGIEEELLTKLPPPLLLSLATCSTDGDDLIRLAESSCEMVRDQNGTVSGLRYVKSGARLLPVIHDHDLYEAVANNPALPDHYKRIMVIRPGAQGGSEIVGESGMMQGFDSHVFEYLRRNSYIAGGHYAANMADDAIRYATSELSRDDIQSLRHLYYQRTYQRLAAQLGLHGFSKDELAAAGGLESLRLRILTELKKKDPVENGTLWGWNFGFDYAPSRYRLHASHQQVHQQYALSPGEVDLYDEGCEKSSGQMPAFGCGDMVAEVIEHYLEEYQSDFFTDYIDCIRNNQRMDGRKDSSASLTVWEDEQVMLFVPKAQTSQWELQLMVTAESGGKKVGNIVEANQQVRRSLDLGILHAQQVLAALGARMVTSIEYSKRIGGKEMNSQRLLYSFLPRLPESPGAFSEAQLRFINGHYPEDFSARCREQISS